MAGHLVSAVGPDREGADCQCSTCFLLFAQSRMSASGTVPATFRVGLLSPVKPLDTHS